jgi:RNA polymerase subunit RPABC4/transcription elongation factor Spt4
VLEVQYDPSFYIYRMADISVLDSMGDVVPEATISSYDFQSSPSIQYYTPDGVTSVPPAAVLNYLGRTASDFALTDHLGQATLPLLTDIVSGPNTPNARTLNAYRLRVDITNHTGVHYSATTVASFIPFPDLSAEAMVQAIEVPIPRFVVDKPLLIATNLVLAPYPIYEGQSATLSFQLENQGTAAAYSVVVDFNDRYDLFNITFDSQVVPRLDPGQKITVSATYTAPMLAGAHLLAVTVDPDNLVPELNDTSERFLWLEIRVGSLAVITMAPEGLQIDPAPPTVNITSIISVKIQKEGDQPSTAKSVTILVQYQDGSRYWLNTTVPALPSGSQIYYAEVAWTPTQLGDYNIYAAMRGIGEEKVSTTVLNYCDLVADSLSLYVNLHQTDVAHIGDTVIMEATISNQGQSDAKNFLIRFWLGNIGDGTILGDLLVPQLNSGQAMMASWDWTAINRAGERYSNYTITVEVNPFQPGDHPINETTYANNVIDTPIEVIDDRPYLQLQGVQVLVSNAASQTAVYGQTLKVDFTVLNNGGGLSALTPVSVYLLAPDNTIYFYYQAQITLTGGGSQHITTTATPVTQPVASYTLVVKAISPVSAASYNGSAWFTQVFDITTLVNPNVAINTFGKVEYKPGESVVAVTTITTSGGAPLVGLKATVMLLDSNNNQLGPTYTYTTGEGGGFTAILGIPFDYSGKATVSMSIAAGSQTIDRTLPIQVGSTASGGMPLWQIILIIVIIAAIILFVFWRFFWHKGGKDMVECGECGSLIPANSKKCPNCGVEFDIGKVRCSNCGTYIDQNLTECPECGAKFSRSAAGKESEEDKELRAEYDAFINDIRMQAKAQLGDKYTEEVFAQWLKTEPEYLPFEQWVARKKEREAAPSAKPCPTCGTLNPATATVCSKCGSQMTAAEDKEAPKPRTFRRIVRRSDKKEEGGEEKPSEEEPKKE